MEPTTTTTTTTRKRKRAGEIKKENAPFAAHTQVRVRHQRHQKDNDRLP
jgi:hypothetical protein